MLNTKDLQNLLPAFVDNLVQSGSSRSTIKNYSSDLKKIFDCLPTDLGIGQDSLDGAITSLNGQFSEATLRRFRYSLKAFSNWLKTQGYTLSNQIATGETASQTKTVQPGLIGQNITKANISSPIDQYSDYIKSQGAATTTTKLYTTAVASFFAWLKPSFKDNQELSQQNIEKVSHNDIERYISYLRSKSVAEGTIQSQLYSLKSFFDLHKDDIVYETNPVKLTRTVIDTKPASVAWQMPGFLPTDILKKFPSLSKPRLWHAYRSHPLSDYVNWAASAGTLLIVGLLVWEGFFAPKPIDINNLKTEIQEGLVLAATPPRILSFQGRLTNDTGTPVTIATNIVFRIWDQSSGGTENDCTGFDDDCLWKSKTWSVTPDSNGIFSVQLGDTGQADTTIPAQLFSDYAELYLGVTIGADSEATPRQRIAASSYALNSDSLDGIDSTGFVQIQPAAAQAAGGATTLIALNENGGSSPSLIDLQVGGVSQFTVTNGGAATLTGNLAVNGGTINSTGTLVLNSATTNAITLDSGTTGTVNLGTGNNAKTINLGTGTAGNTINIGTNNTTSDTINIGSALDNVALTGDQWSITDAGALTVASCSGCGGATFSGEVDDATNDALTFTSDDASPPSGLRALYATNTNDLNLNVKNGGLLNIQENDATEFSFSDSTLAFNSNTITGLGTSLTAAAGLSINTTSNGNLTLAPNGTGVIIASSATTTGDAFSLSDTALTTGKLASLSFTSALTASGTTTGLQLSPTIAGTAAANTYTTNTFDLAAIAGACPAGATCRNNAINIGSQAIADADQTSVALNIADQYNATGTHYGICFDCDGTYSNSQSSNGINWGNDANLVTLYRSTDNTLRTGDNLTVDLDLIVSGGDVTGANGDWLDIAETANSQFTFNINSDSTVTLISADNVNANTPLTISSAGTGTLTLNPSGTGDIVLTSSNTGTAAIDINVNGTGGDLDIDVNDALTVDAATMTFTLAAGTTDLTFAGLDADSNIILPGLAGANAVLYAAPTTGVLTTATTTTGSQCLTSTAGASGTPSWGSCGGGGFSGEVDDATNDALTFTSDDASPPAGTVNSIFRDNSGDLNINVVTGKTLNLQNNGSDIFKFGLNGFGVSTLEVSPVGLQQTTLGSLWYDFDTNDTGIADSVKFRGGSSFTDILSINGIPGADVTGDSAKLTLRANGTGSTNTLQGLVVSQIDTATTGVYDSLVKIENLKTPETTTNGILIEQNAASGTLTNAINIVNTAGTLTTGINFSAGTLTTGINLSGASTTTDLVLDDGLTFAQTSDNDLDLVENSQTLNLDFAETTGSTITLSTSAALSIASDTSSTLTLDSGTTGQIDIGVNNNSKTINLGTGTAVNTINIGTGGAASAEVITIGSTDTDTSLVLNSGGASSTINFPTFDLDTLGNILATNSTEGTTRTTEAVNRNGVTTVTITVAGFANNDVIKTTRSGVDYYARITAGGGTTSLTVSPAVSYDSSSTVTKWVTQNIGATQSSRAASLRYFQGLFLGGVVTGSGSTTFADGYIASDQTTFNFDIGASGTLNFRDDAGNVLATLTDNGSTGNLNVTGTVSTSATTGNQGWWSRSGTDLTPVNSGDSLINLGNITGSGALTLGSGGSSTLNLNSADGNITIASGDALLLSIAGNPGTGTEGQFWYDTTANKFKINENGTVKTLCNLTDGGCGAGGGFSGEVDDVTNDALTFTSDDASPPAGTVNSIFRDNSGDLNINTVTGKSLNLQIAGTDILQLSSTGINLAGSGADITFANGEKIENDTNGFIKLLGNAAVGSGTLTYTNGQSILQVTGNINNAGTACPTPAFGGCAGLYVFPTMNITSSTGVAWGTASTLKVDDETAGAITLTEGISLGAANLQTGTNDVITNAYGVHIANITAGGTKNIGLCFDCIDGSFESTTVSAGIQFGNDANSVNLYRSASNTLKTDDTLSLGAGISGAGLTDCDTGNNKLTWDSSNNQFGCSSTQANSFSDTATNAWGDNDTTDLWNGTTPSITTTSNTNDVLVLAFIRINSDPGAAETNPVARIDREGAGVTSDCADTNTVGPTFGTTLSHSATGDAAMILTAATMFVDAPGTAGTYEYNLCTSADSVSITGTVQKLRADITLFELNDAADLAEVYPTNDPTLAMAEVVSLDQLLESGVKRTARAYDSKVIGVVSTRPASVIGGTDGNAYGVPIALTGRVPVKVSDENGPIQPGDLLTSSSVPGVAMKATKAGYVIGRALGKWENPGTGAVMVFVNTHYADPEKISQTESEINLDFLNATDSAKLSTNSAKLASQALLSLEEESNNLIASISAGAQFVWKNTAGQMVAWVSDTGEALFKSVTATLGNFTKLVFGEAVVKKEARSAGEASFEAGATEIFIESDKINEESLINLTATTKTNGLSLYVKEKRPGEGFVVALERNSGDQPNQATTSATTAIKFTWFIINQKP